MHRMSSPRTRHLCRCLALLTATAAWAGCAKDDPMEPTSDEPAAVALTSTKDSVVAVGFTAQLTAVAATADGRSLTGVAFTWSSSNQTVATVDNSGLVSVAGAGTTTITAAAETVSGTFALRGVETEVAEIGTVVSDAFVSTLAGALTATTSSAVSTQLTSCNAGLAGGDLLPVHSCLTALRTITGDGGGTDTVVLAVLDLFWDHALQLLNFGR